MASTLYLHICKPRKGTVNMWCKWSQLVHLCRAPTLNGAWSLEVVLGEWAEGAGTWLYLAADFRNLHTEASFHWIKTNVWVMSCADITRRYHITRRQEFPAPLSSPGTTWSLWPSLTERPGGTWLSLSMSWMSLVHTKCSGPLPCGESCLLGTWKWEFLVSYSLGQNDNFHSLSSRSLCNLFLN